jgi:hypothetical protein
VPTSRRSAGQPVDPAEQGDMDHPLVASAMPFEIAMSKAWVDNLVTAAASGPPPAAIGIPAAGAPT